MRESLRSANESYASSRPIHFPGADIIASLENDQSGGLQSSAFLCLRGELAARLNLLGRRLGETHALGRSTGTFWNQVVEASLEVLSLFTALEAERAALMAALDPLTGLAGRRVLDEYLQQERARIQREGHNCAVALLDIDYFKIINDTHGHQSGDQVLMRFAALLKDNTRTYDGVYRYGGEEFVLCLPGVDAARAKYLVDRIRLAVSKAPFSAADGARLNISFSAGIADLTAAALPEQVMDLADAALYRAKADGRSRVYVAPAASNSQIAG